MKKGRGLLTEFKEFISRGSVIDLAIGVIIGAAFTAIVTSLVNDILSPVIGLILRGTDLSSYKFVIAPAEGNLPESAIKYGSFIQSVIHFLLTSIVIFFLMKGLNAFHRKKEETAPEPKAPDPQIELLTEIRDLLKKEAE